MCVSQNRLEKEFYVLHAKSGGIVQLGVHVLPIRFQPCIIDAQELSSPSYHVNVKALFLSPLSVHKLKDAVVWISVLEQYAHALKRTLRIRNEKPTPAHVWHRIDLWSGRYQRNCGWNLAVSVRNAPHRRFWELRLPWAAAEIKEGVSIVQTGIGISGEIHVPHLSGKRNLQAAEHRPH